MPKAQKPRHEFIAVVTEWIVVSLSILVFVNGVIEQFRGSPRLAFVFYLLGFIVFAIARALGSNIRYPRTRRNQ